MPSTPIRKKRSNLFPGLGMKKAIARAIAFCLSIGSVYPLSSKIGYVKPGLAGSRKVQDFPVFALTW
jgi:hypothetical protein